MLDELFGKGASTGSDAGFRNEIAFCYSGGGIPQKKCRENTTQYIGIQRVIHGRLTRFTDHIQKARFNAVELP